MKNDLYNNYLANAAVVKMEHDGACNFQFENTDHVVSFIFAHKGIRNLTVDERNPRILLRTMPIPSYQGLEPIKVSATSFSIMVNIHEPEFATVYNFQLTEDLQ